MFGYTLAEVRKVVVAFVLAAAYVVVFLVLPDNADKLSFVEACVALVGPVFAVIGVFGATNHTPEDLQKALEALKGAALTVVGYFTVINPSDAQQISLLIGAAVAVVAVYWVPNEGRGAAGAARGAAARR